MKAKLSIKPIIDPPMLNNIIFINRIRDVEPDTIIYHGSSHRFIKEAIAGQKWHFGCAANYEADGEGLQYPGEREAVDQFFHIDSPVSETDALSAQLIHGAIGDSHKDIYNSCWSTSQDIALRFATKYDDGVVISVKVSALADAINDLANEWTQRSENAERKFFELLEEGFPEGIPEIGLGQVQASAEPIRYIPKEFKHQSNEGNCGSTDFMSPILRNMRLPQSYGEINLQAEKEVRFSLNLSHSEGCRFRNPTGLSNTLAPMITQANGTSNHHGIWLHGLSINRVEGFSMIQAYLF